MAKFSTFFFRLMIEIIFTPRVNIEEIEKTYSQQLFYFLFKYLNISLICVISNLHDRK